MRQFEFEEITRREERHQAIDARFELVKGEIKAMAQRALDEIANKVSFFNRSASQIRRYEKAKKEKKNE